MVTTEMEASGRATVAQRWLARLALVAAAAAVLVPLLAIGFRASVAVTVIGVVGLALTAAGVATNKGVVRWLAVALAVLAPLVVLVCTRAGGCCGSCWWRWGCWSWRWSPAGPRWAARPYPSGCASMTPRRPSGRT